MLCSLILCAIQSPQNVINLDQYLTLGREREQFGDPYPDSTDGKKMEWNCNQTTFPITTALFPAGVSDRRIYIKSAPNDPDKGKNGGLDIFFVKKIKGKVVPQWRIRAWQALIPLPPLPESAGTLESLCYWYELDLAKAKIPSAAWPVLRARKAYATYRFDALMDRMELGFIQENGMPLLIKPPTYMSVKGHKPLPYIGYDYPILAEEIAYLSKHHKN